MRQTGFPVQFPTPAQAMPAVRMAQPAIQGWSPARRAQPMVAQRLSRSVGPVMSGKMGQTEAMLWARGSDIAFSILTGLAAIVSGLGLVIEFGKGEPGRRGVAPAVPGRPGVVPRPTGVVGAKAAQPVWYVIGGAVALMGVANIWSSINRAAALQIPGQTTASTRASS